MKRHAHACALLAAAFAAGIMLLVLTPVATGAPSCGDTVLLDWSDNGRIDKLYALHCYDEAIDEMPADLRDYTDASDVITRALAVAAARGDDTGGPQSSAGMGPEIDTSEPSSVPIPLVALAGLSLVVLAAGGLGYVSRRRHDAD
jgi:hypothetical protein